jgi:hypothetical protein
MPENVRDTSDEAFAPLKADSRQGEANGGCAVEYLDRVLYRAVT